MMEVNLVYFIVSQLFVLLYQIIYLFQPHVFALQLKAMSIFFILFICFMSEYRHYLPFISRRNVCPL